MIYAPLGSTANKHGRIIGDNITGGCEEFDGVVGTMIFKVLNLTVAKTGLTEQDARACGFRVATSLTPCLDHVHFYPGGKFLMIKIIAEQESGRFLGAQIIGPGDAAKRVDVLAAALQNQMTLRDIANLDLGYSPPYSHAMECVIQAANHARNRIDGLAHVMNADQVQQKLLQEDLLLLDVREQKEAESNPIFCEAVKNIPLTSLRYRLDEIPKNKPIVCCCAQGTRSYEACLILQANHFDSVYYLDGGLRIWRSFFRDKKECYS
jgi:rhodanese-related sulfurtransferase